MAEITGLTLVKRFSYRGQNEEWSNKYYMSGAPPASPAGWKTLADQIIAQEVTCYLGSSAVVRAYGYSDDDPNADNVWLYDYLAAAATVAGTASTGTGTYPAGDQAGWIRWKTSRLTSPGGKPIYLRKYFHSVPTDEDSPSTSDNVAPGWATAANAYAQKWLDGTGAWARTLRSRTHPETLTARSCSTWITVRTLKRRGKRPGS